MSNWRAKGKKISEGKWIRFDQENNVRIITFLGEPDEVEKTVQQGPRKGETYTVLSFPVECDGEDKILEPNRALLKLLMDEDEDEEIIGGTYRIKAIDAPTNKTWKINRIADGSLNDVGKKRKAKKDIEEEEKEEQEEEPTEEEKEKERFKEEVEKRTAKRKKKEKEATEEKGENGPNEEKEGAGREEADTVE